MLWDPCHRVLLALHDCSKVLSLTHPEELCSLQSLALSVPPHAHQLGLGCMGRGTHLCTPQEGRA